MKIQEIINEDITAPFDINDMSDLPQYINGYFRNPSYFNNEKLIKIEIHPWSFEEIKTPTLSLKKLKRQHDAWRKWNTHMKLKKNLERKH